MLLINVVLQLCKGAAEGSHSGAICTDATSDVMCFGQGQPLDTWRGLSFPLLPFSYLFILDAYIVQERGLVCYPHSQRSWKTGDTTSDWHPPESRASCICCSKDRKFSKQGILVETLLLLASCILLLQSLSTSQNRSRKTEAFGSCLGRTRLFNCVKHSCMPERTLGLAFTRNLFRTLLNGLTRNKICTWVSSPHVTLRRSLHWAGKLNFCWLER